MRRLFAVGVSVLMVSALPMVADAAYPGPTESALADRDFITAPPGLDDHSAASSGRLWVAPDSSRLVLRVARHSTGQRGLLSIPTDGSLSGSFAFGWVPEFVFPLVKFAPDSSRMVWCEPGGLFSDLPVGGSRVKLADRCAENLYWVSPDSTVVVVFVPNSSSPVPCPSSPGRMLAVPIAGGAATAIGELVGCPSPSAGDESLGTGGAGPPVFTDAGDYIVLNADIDPRTTAQLPRLHAFRTDGSADPVMLDDQQTIGGVVVGDRVVFPVGLDDQTLVSVRPDGSHRVSLNTASASLPFVFASNKRVLYVDLVPDGGPATSYELWSIETDGSDRRRLASVSPPGAGGFGFLWDAFTDARFVGVTDTNPSTGLMTHSVLNLATHEMRRVATDVSWSIGRPSSDGRWVVTTESPVGSSALRATDSGQIVVPDGELRAGFFSPNSQWYFAEELDTSTARGGRWLAFPLALGGVGTPKIVTSPPTGWLHGTSADSTLLVGREDVAGLPTLFTYALGGIRPGPAGEQVGLVDPSQGRWHLRNEAGQVTSFFFGNPGDVPVIGDWDGDGVDTPGLFRTSDAFAYLSNANRSQIADVRFFFGNPSDVPLAGDWDGDGDDTLSIYRPSEQRFYIVNELGQDEGGLGPADFSFLFGNPGDKPVVGDWDGDGIDEVGLHRESTGFFYWRNTLTTGAADGSLFFGDPGDRFVGGDWGSVDSHDTPAVFRPSNATFFFRYTLTQGVADAQRAFGESSWLPVAGEFGLG